jgi:hypothetical protein
MRKDKYGRRYNQPVYTFGILLIALAFVAILLMKCQAN